MTKTLAAWLFYSYFSNYYVELHLNSTSITCLERKLLLEPSKKDDEIQVKIIEDAGIMND